MKFAGIGWILLALAFGLGLLIATADDAELAGFDPFRPVTLLRIVANRLDAVDAAVRGWADDFLAAATAFRHHRRPDVPEEELIR